MLFFNVESGGHKHTMYAMPEMSTPGNQAMISLLINPQRIGIIDKIKLVLHKVNEGKEEKLYLGLMASNDYKEDSFGVNHEVTAKAKKCAIVLPPKAEKLLKTEPHFMTMQSYELPLFYEDLFSTHRSAENNFAELRTKLIETEFLGPDKAKREEYVELMIDTAKALLSVTNLAHNHEVKMLSTNSALSEATKAKKRT